MDEFESLLREHENVVSRFVKFKINDIHDAEDIIQETYLSASRKFETLQNKAAFKAWIISIARNKCNDYFRAKADCLAIPIDSLDESVLTKGRYGIRPHSVVRDTLELLRDKDKQILYLYFFKEYSQEEIAGRLNIPVGTVKSRLYNAKKHFKEKYPYRPAQAKGANNMKNKLPLYLPEYIIEKSDKEPFNVKWEELMGWFLVPKLGEKISWAMYDYPERKRTESTRMEVIGRAEVHGIEGVEIATYEYEPMECNITDNDSLAERRFVAQLTDTHCRCLAESHMENGVRKCYTFLDGDSFLENWGFGENNCGNETNLEAKGLIMRKDNVITSKNEKELLDVVGRYTVTINGKNYDTICVMDIEYYNGGVATEQFIDDNGRTVLWRRFNSDSWGFDRYNKRWSEMLPESERLIINGGEFVHWYDCITDYIL